MKILAVGFSRNGKQDLVGTLKAVEDDGEPLGVQHKGNYSDLKVKNFFIKALVEELGVTEDRARAAVTRALRELDKNLSAGEARPDEDDGKKSQATQLVDLALGTGHGTPTTPKGIAKSTLPPLRCPYENTSCRIQSER